MIEHHRQDGCIKTFAGWINHQRVMVGQKFPQMTRDVTSQESCGLDPVAQGIALGMTNGG